MTQTSTSQLSDFLEKRNELVSLLQRQQAVLQILKMAAWQEKVHHSILFK